MSHISMSLNYELTAFISKIESRALQLVRTGAYQLGSEYTVAAQALRAYVEDKLEGDMDAISERNFEAHQAHGWDGPSLQEQQAEAKKLK